MKLLALDTSTEYFSLAVTAPGGGTARVWQQAGPGGAQTSAHLIPAIEALMQEAGLHYADLDAIAFGQGPGSFTGVRTACSVAQGLGLGANVPLLPIDTLLALAEEARWQHAPQAAHCRVLALLDARMDELYAARFVHADGCWQTVEDGRLLRPEQLTRHDDEAAAGNVFAAYGARLPLPATQPRWPALPTATAMLRLAPALLAAGQAVPAEQALPRYIRDKVAQTTAERAAARGAEPA